MQTDHPSGPSDRFSKNLRAARIAAGMTTAELAERAGVGIRTVQRIESGQHAPLLDTASDLARAVGVPLHELAGSTSRRGGDSSESGTTPAREGE